jgi:hypothetical protein
VFVPDEGPLLLRVRPVTGFQALMRVQDAVARLPSVRHAAVEAYAQGEARLRLDLKEAVYAEDIASELGRRLARPAQTGRIEGAPRAVLLIELG